MQWKFTLSAKLSHEQQRDILKKHFIKKEPFSKVSIHQMHIPDMVEQFLDSGLRIVIDTDSKEIELMPKRED